MNKWYASVDEELFTLISLFFIFSPSHFELILLASF